MKKGRHRRFEEARAFKLRPTESAPEPCAECGADPEDDHASWCLATEELATDDLATDDLATDDLATDNLEHGSSAVAGDGQEPGGAGHPHAAGGT